jgi:hypothetical protein
VRYLRGGRGNGLSYNSGHDQRRSAANNSATQSGNTRGTADHLKQFCSACDTFSYYVS